jgi:hypothetical protein
MADLCLLGIERIYTKELGPDRAIVDAIARGSLISTSKFLTTAFPAVGLSSAAPQEMARWVGWPRLDPARELAVGPPIELRRFPGHVI